MTVRVDLIATPELHYGNMKRVGYVPHPAGTVNPSDELTEFAGRQCYLSWTRPNPSTATNGGYIEKTVHDQEHESILEHAQIVVRVTGISRSLLLQLERHRHLQYSVLSQRFVDESERATEPIIPPLFRGTPMETRLRDMYEQLVTEYGDLVNDGVAHWPDLPRKQIREAARAVMPNMTPTEAVISANLRAWRYVIALRLTPEADAEIRELARELLVVLRRVAPNVMADM